MNCAVCSAAFEVTAARRKTCSTACANENKRRMRRVKERRRKKRLPRRELTPAQQEKKRARQRAWYQRNREACRAYYQQNRERLLALARQWRLEHHPRVCLGCGADIAYIRHLRYCPACHPEAVRKARWLASLPANCLRCGTASKYLTAHYCRSCARARRREYAAAIKVRIDAAVQVYRLMRGEPLVQSNRPLTDQPYRPRCLACGITLTARERKRTCSETCRVARRRDRYIAHYYYGQSPPRPELPPKNVRISGAKRTRRAAHAVDKITTRPLSPRQRERRRQYDIERRAIYEAFRDYNLLPLQPPLRNGETP